MYVFQAGALTSEPHQLHILFTFKNLNRRVGQGSEVKAGAEAGAGVRVFG